MLALVAPVCIWRPYLLWRKFSIQTDLHNILKFLLEQRILTPKQQKWVAKLLGYDYENLYRPGALSRVTGSPTLQALSCLKYMCRMKLKKIS